MSRGSFGWDAYDEEPGDEKEPAASLVARPEARFVPASVEHGEGLPPALVVPSDAPSLVVGLPALVIDRSGSMGEVRRMEAVLQVPAVLGGLFIASSAAIDIAAVRVGCSVLVLAGGYAAPLEALRVSEEECLDGFYEARFPFVHTECSFGTVLGLDFRPFTYGIVRAGFYGWQT